MRWSPGTHHQCPAEVRFAARVRALFLGGRGPPVLNCDVWGVVFSFLVGGKHARRPLQEGDHAIIDSCCVNGVAPCAACRRAVYADGASTPSLVDFYVCM